MKITVAGINTEIIHIDSEYFEKRYKSYMGDFDKPMLKICNVEAENMSRAIEYTSDEAYSDTVIRYLRNHRFKKLSRTSYEYMYAGFAFSNRLICTGGVPLHASGISYKGLGVAFTAPSGTGKSTHSSLWKKYLTDDVEYVNDDKPVVSFENGIPYMYGTPWSGKTELNNNIKVPLKALVYIKRGTANKIEQLSPSDSFYRIYQETVKPDKDEKLMMKLIDNIEKIITAVPMYILECDMSRQAVLTSKNKVFGGVI